MTSPHWAAHYIRRNPPIEWESGAQGPAAYDCWSFFRMIQSRHFGIEVPIIRIDADDREAVREAFGDAGYYDGWVKVDVPRDGDAVIFLGGLDEDHIGVWLGADYGGVFHCMRKSGVVFTRSEVVRRLGWGRVEFYRYGGERCAPR